MSELKPKQDAPKPARDPKLELDWTRRCVSCGETPIVPMTRMCGPCTFGEADTVAGNW